MVWNSPFQSLQRTEPADKNKTSYTLFEDKCIKDQTITESVESMEYIDPDVSLNTLLNCDSLLNDSLLPTTRNQPINYNTDIPALDSLFSELNSDLNLDRDTATGPGGGDLGAKSEPVNLDDIERILLPQSARRGSKNHGLSLNIYAACIIVSLSTFHLVRQPFSSILNSFSNLPTGPFDSNTSSMMNEISPMLWDGSDLSQSQISQQPEQPLIPLNSQASTSQGGKIQVKVIGKRHREPESSQIYHPSSSNIKQVPYIPAPVGSKPARSYRTYGKKRYIIGPEYADFVCRLQNDIPFDSSEDDDEDEDQLFNKTSRGNNESSEASESEDEDDEEEEENERIKISPQELLELFEDSCSGLPGLISAFLTHRKHQIGLKGYKPRVLPSSTKSTTSPPPALLNQNQFDRIQNQIKLHFQFLIQNLALSNEIEGGEGITLLNLKLLVQLHLHLDSICNLRGGTSTSTANTQQNGTCTVVHPNTRISCLNLPQPRVNPIVSRLIELIPPGIKKVGIIAGFLVRPGQKQFLSLAALRSDPTLKPKVTSTTNPAGPALPLKIKYFASTQSGQILSNAFYNILALFHDYIDPKLLETTTSVNNLSKYIDNGGCSTPGPESTSSRTAKFLASEDNLLLSGLHRFGCGNWESIQSHFLPFRTSRQLAVRYKNLSSRREAMNPIKEFNERLMMPLNEIEEDLLVKGVQRFGNQFHLISKHYLPHRPATVLGKLWKAMDDARRNYKK